MIYSVYGEGTFFVAFGAMSFLFLLTFAVAAGCISRTLYKRAVVSRPVRILTALMGFLSGLFLSLDFSTLSAFGFIHPAGAMMLCSIAWLLLTPFITACFAPAARLNRIMERTTAKQLRVLDEDEHIEEEHHGKYNMMAQAHEIVTNLNNPNTPTVANTGDSSGFPAGHQQDVSQQQGGISKRRGANVNANNGTAAVPISSNADANNHGDSDDSDMEIVKVGVKALLLRLNPALRGVILDVMRRPIPHFTTFMVGLMLSLIFVLVTYGACFCNQPKVLTTWASRYSAEKACTPGEVCFQYSLVGGNCSELIGVAHFVAKDDSGSDDTVPKRFTAEVCPESGCKNGIEPVTFYGWVTPHNQISEDPRYIGSVVLKGLRGNVNYRVKMAFALYDGTIVVAKKTLVTRTVPCDDNDGNTTFIGGGDWRVGGLGKSILKKSMAKYPNASFVYIGGDLAYGNNMRTCYMRWDVFLQEFIEASTRPQDGALLPFLAAVGNHEGGGYLLASTYHQRQDRYYFYHQYFPHGYSSIVDPGMANTRNDGHNSSALTGSLTSSVSSTDLDSSVTFHSHTMGSSLGIIVLDSDIMHSVKSQIEFLKTSLAVLPTYQHHTATAAVTPVVRRKIIVIYHNPAYPSHREFDDMISESVRKYFLPPVEAAGNDVALVLEHHDHTFKRTHPLRGGKIINNTAVTDKNKRGLVYIGDGALGVSEADREVYESRSYIDVAKSENYFVGISTYPDGSMTCIAHHGETGEAFDEYKYRA